MFTIQLKYGEEDWYTLNSAPTGWDKIKYTITRSAMFWATNREVTAPIVFIKDGKDFIDNKTDLYGLESEIQCRIYVYLSQSRRNELLLEGVLKFDEGSYKRTQTTTECRVVDGSFEQLIYNRRKIKVDYNSLESIDGDIIVKNPIEYEELLIRLSNSEITTQSVYPFQLFERIVQVLTGKEHRFRSSIFANGYSDGYSSIGDCATKMLVAGNWIRGYNSELTGLSISLEDLFTSFDAIRGLGLGFTTFNNNRCVEIEQKKHFFQQQVVLEFTDIWDLVISPIDELMLNEIEVGYPVQKRQDNEIGQVEYNSKMNYSVPTKMSEKALKIVSKLRADGTGIEKISTATETEKSTPDDKDIFVVDSFIDSGILKSRKTELFSEVSGVYSDKEIYINVALSPRRMIKNHEEIVSIPLKNLQDKKIKIQSSETPSKLVTQLLTETQPLYDNLDIEIRDLVKPYLSGMKANFNSVVGVEQVVSLNINKYGLCKFWNYVQNKNGYGWVKEISTGITDKDTNIELWLINDEIEILEDECLWEAEDGSLALAEESSFIPCETNY